jgi:putative tricarboxylic transport membrane protein
LTFFEFAHSQGVYDYFLWHYRGPRRAGADQGNQVKNGFTGPLKYFCMEEKKMKKWGIGVLSICLVLFFSCSRSREGGSREGSAAWAPTRNIEFVVTSSAGGGSDVFARTISGILSEAKLVAETIVVNNQTDGNGEVGRLTVSRTTGPTANHTLLSMNSGDCGDMLKNTQNRVGNFRLIATMAVDKQLLFVSPTGKYKDFAGILAALDRGETVIMSGSKGSDTTTVDALLKEIRVTPAQLKYIVYDASSDAITAILGDHVDVVISKPGAAMQYAEAGRVIPVLALSDSRFNDVPILAGAPTLSEVDGKYQDVERPVWRSVVAPAAMSDEAAAFWSDALGKVAETDAWKTYVTANSLLFDYRDAEATRAYITAFEKQYLEELAQGS